METPIEVLRIEHSAISKELSRFRACDSETRCFYCREWSQYVYKKHFVWSAKTQEDVSQDDPEKLLAGRYQVNLLNGTTPAKQKERSPKLSERFEKLLETQSESSSDATLTEDIISACALWQTLPSSLSGLPSIFESVQFNPYPDAIPLADDPKEPAHLLDPLIIERQTLCLPAEGFHLLKNLTGDILMSHTQPTCNHTRPESRSPADLEIDRTIYNEKLDQVTKGAMKDLEHALDHSWRHLTEFLQRLLELEKERNILMGRRSKDSVDQFAEKQKMPTFQDYWEEKTTEFKKKKMDVKTVDTALTTYFDRLSHCAEEFQTDFAITRLAALRRLIQKLWDLVVPTIQKMADRMASHEQQDERHMENCKAVSASLRGLHPADDVDVAVKRIQSEMDGRVKEFKQDIAAVLHMYKEETKTSVSARLDKVAQKDFKRKLKRAENGYHSLRQYFKYEVTQKIFPEPLFCKFCLVCIEALMQEGEVMEAVTIEKEVKRFLESHKDLVRQRQQLLNEFEDGVQVGRRELAGVLGKLFLKEGMRIQGENLALKRQNSLLKSIGMSGQTEGSPAPTTPSNKKKKNKKKKKKAAATSATSSTVGVSDTASVSANESSRAPSACSSPRPPAQAPIDDDSSNVNVDTLAPPVEVDQPPSPKIDDKPKSPELSKQQPAAPELPSAKQQQKQQQKKKKQPTAAQPKKASDKVSSKPATEATKAPVATHAQSAAASEVSQPKIKATKEPQPPQEAMDISRKATPSPEKSPVNPVAAEAEAGNLLGPVNDDVDETKSESVQSEDATITEPMLSEPVQPAPANASIKSAVDSPKATADNGGWNNASTPGTFTPPGIAGGSSPSLNLNGNRSWSPMSREGSGNSWNVNKPLLSTTTTTSTGWGPGLGGGWDTPKSNGGGRPGWLDNGTPLADNHWLQPQQQRPPGLAAAAAAAAAAEQQQQPKMYQQIPVPDEVRDLSPDNLIALVHNLHQENGQLVHAMNSMRQEMALMTRQYTDMMTLSREREEQLTQIFEARRRTDMEESRRHFAGLESKINNLQLQQQQQQQHEQPSLLSPIKTSSAAPGAGIMAGFGNQDLFAGYREEMRSNHHHNRKLWQKSVRVRCGNCGGTGHSSSECKDSCRYCGASDHLSEACQFS
ncbi:hypothetical protein BDB00DRAFT_830007 [Zychaea mexicana]|uniref:uncharacterized protein n=1 Tax=Zychaea mexicana TaxID=64656 RepID=UPI0022FDF8A8|nr:uncharacterized protein BDB00DRAFT_830007 [Zychaea mexicana]KAI9492054.1 hypothetical protein BDB00DRAFT_830007 [Zychaea mexicana]